MGVDIARFGDDADALGLTFAQRHVARTAASGQTVGWFMRPKYKYDPLARKSTYDPLRRWRDR